MAKPQEKVSFGQRLKQIGMVFQFTAKQDRWFAPLVAAAVLIPLALTVVAVILWSWICRMGSAEGAQPEGRCWLLDRASPDSGKELAQQIPPVVGQVFLFGKQTDGQRLEMIAYRTTLDKAKTAVGEIGGDALGPIVEEEVTSQVPAAPASTGRSGAT